jgi:hypothetical protein
MEFADGESCFYLQNRDLSLNGTDDDETILFHLQNIRRALQQGEIEKI